jgi:Protein of unknown function (DUF2585)
MLAGSNRSLMPTRAAWLLSLVLWAYCAFILYAMQRPWICECVTVKLWHGVVQSAENSQHLADWYTFSHIIHGLIFYAGAHLLWRRWNLFDGAPTRWALPIAVALEASWEVLENSPVIIERYRSVTASFGYSGDSIVNSMADIGWMILGFWLASRLPWKASVAMVIAFELLTLAIIRDNLTLNVLMLIAPIDAVRDWQALG